MTVLPDIKQQDASELPSTCWDVAIVGAGPAGSIAACHLASQGWRTLLIERDAFPRDKVCGDGLIPDAIRCLERARLLERVRTMAHPVSSLRVFSPSRAAVDLPGSFLTIKRLHLDHLLAHAATERGATLCRGRVKSVDAEDGRPARVSLFDAPTVLTAKIVVLLPSTCPRTDTI